MPRYTLKCHRHHRTDCTLGCRRPARGTRLTTSSQYGYYNADNLLTAYMIGEILSAVPNTVEVTTEAALATPSYDSAPSSDSPFSGGGDFGFSSSPDSSYGGSD